MNDISRNADTIFIGRVLGADALGLYSRAYNLSTSPMLNIGIAILQVGLPALSRLTELPERFAKYDLKSARGCRCAYGTSSPLSASWKAPS